MTAELKLGGEIDSFCTHCKLDLNHTITLLHEGKVKKVKCNTCGFEHVPRAKPGSAAPKKSRSTKAADAAAAATSEFLRLLGKRDLATASSYALDKSYQQGDLIQHKGFGIGVVTSVKPDRKMLVMFKDGLRTLVHGWTP